MDIRNTMNYSLFALLILTALIAGKSVDGYPAGGAQEGAGDEWAADAIEKGALALSPRGELFTADNIRGRLNMRDFLDTMRSSGVDTGGPPALSQSDRQAFANHLDTLLSKANN